MQIDRRGFIASALGAAAALAVPGRGAAQSSAAAPREAVNQRFVVLYKGDPIGTHIVAGSSDGGEIHAETSIKLVVKAAFITLYSYEHRSQEVWRDSKLVSLHSETKEDSETYRVEGAATPEGFRVVSAAGPFVAPTGLLTSNSMWVPGIVSQQTLIDAQHGGVIGVTTRKIGDEQVAAAKGTIAATRYKFLTPHCAGDIWFDGTGHWVRGEFERNGARITYRLEA